jgi:hypothetical protein
MWAKETKQMWTLQEYIAACTRTERTDRKNFNTFSTRQRFLRVIMFNFHATYQNFSSETTQSVSLSSLSSVLLGALNTWIINPAWGSIPREKRCYLNKNEIITIPGNELKRMTLRQ